MAGNRRILVLDDEAPIREAYQSILMPSMADVPVVRSSRRGRATTAPEPRVAAATETFEVTLVESGSEALAAINMSVCNHQSFAMGFFDVKIGGEFDGIETIRRAKEMDPDLLCVIVTAYQDRSIEEIGRIFGDDFADRWDFVNKPFSQAEILQKARNLCANWDRRKREREYIQQIKSQQEQLVLSERLAAVGTLARGIGHEFGNILLSIMGNADLALQTKEPKEMEDALKIIAKSSDRAAILVRNLQSMVKMERRREKLALSVPVKEALELIGHELKKKAIKVVEDFAADLPELNLNKIEMGQVILNMAINSIHALEPKGGEIRIRAKLDDKKAGVILEFEDTGCGIPDDHIDRVFEPLFTTKGGKGSGIGLSVSKKIVENHGGRISVESAVGKGTVFTIWLPI